MTTRSRMATARVASPRYLPQALSLMLELKAVEALPCLRSMRLKRVWAAGLVLALLHLAEVDVVDDQEIGCGPSLEAALVGGVGEPGVEVVEEVDAAGVADRHLGLAAAQGDGLEDVTLASAARASHIVPTHRLD
jgi:hypothetical protein